MSKEWKYFIIAGGIILIVWVASFAIIYVFIDEWENRGQFGDLFGAVNALFSGLAFAGLVITIMQQRHDLQLQRNAIEQTNKEMQQQTQEFDTQNETLRRQQFDNTYFELLHMLQTIVGDLTLNVEYSQYIDDDQHKKSFTCKGRNVFQELFTRRHYKVVAGTSRLLESLKEEINKNGVDKTFARDEFKFLYHYFRFVYRIIKYVDESTFLKYYNEKYSYISFLRSTLSNYEIAVLFYNCLTGNESENFKPLIERYALFNNIDTNLLCNSNDIKLYDEFAFKRHEPSLIITHTNFQMRCVRSGLYQWIIEIRMNALYGDVVINEITLKNTDFFIGNMFSKAKELRLSEYYTICDLKASMPHYVFKNKQIIWNGFKKSISCQEIKENKTENMTFGDIMNNTLNLLLTNSNNIVMPTENWTLNIIYNSNNVVEIPIKQIVVKEQR